MLDGMVGSLAPRAQAKRLELTCHASPGVPSRVVGDPRRLRQILVNLLSNAITFTERGRVELDVKVESRGAGSTTLHFVVTDTGDGVPADQPGTGLGLAISRHLTTLLGGRLWVESEPGHGSRVHVVVGLRQSLDPPATPEAVGLVLAGTPELVEPQRQAPLRSLLAEDNGVNTRLIPAILDKRGYVTPAVANGREAATVAAAMTFDLAVMDAQMPETDGFETTRAIRRASVPEPEPADAEPTPPRASVSFDAAAFLARIDGDRVLLAELVGLLKHQIPVALAEIRRCIESGDGPGLQRAAHKLRGSVLQFGAGAAAAAALALENRARDGAVPDAGFPLRALEQELARLMSEIGRFEEVGTP